VAELLGRLGGRDRQVLILHFGLDGAGERTTAEIARLLGVSSSGTSRVVQRAVNALRRAAGVEDDFKRAPGGRDAYPEPQRPAWPLPPRWPTHQA